MYKIKSTSIKSKQGQTLSVLTTNAEFDNFEDCIKKFEKMVKEEADFIVWVSVEFQWQMTIELSKDDMLLKTLTFTNY